MVLSREWCGGALGSLKYGRYRAAGGQGKVNARTVVCVENLRMCDRGLHCKHDTPGDSCAAHFIKDFVN